jgi:hypothetical protein
VPLQSIENLNSYQNLLPGTEKTLMTLTRTSESSSLELARYWFGAPSLTSHALILVSAQVYEVFAPYSMATEVTTLPCPFARLESVTTHVPSSQGRQLS